MNRIHKLAYAIFGKYVIKNKDHYSSIQQAIKQAHLGMPWDIYVTLAYLSGVISGLLFGILLYLLMPFWKLLYAHYVKVAPRVGFGDYGEILFILFIELFLSILIGLVVHYGIMAYPELVSRIRKSKIELTLPHAVAYMHALSKGGLSIIPIFKSLNEHMNVYGEAAEEIGYIVMDTEIHGEDLISALKNAAVRTQSNKFRDFLENLINVAETSGDLETFFGSMVEHYQTSSEADQTMYLEMLGMLAETYITVFVAGPLFLITILIVMGMMGRSTSLLIIDLLIYAVIPLSALLFSILLSIISLRSETKLSKIYSVTRKLRHYDDVRTSEPSPGDQRLVRKLTRSLRWTSVTKTRRDPLKIFYSDPFNAFYISVPFAGIYFILSIYQKKISIDILDDSIIISTLILLVPFLFFYEVQTRRIKAIENSVPDFLRRLAVINEVGMPLADAIKTISNINLGVLSTEVKIMYKDLVWSNSVFDALVKFERRIRTISISRIVTLITKASESSGNIKETLRVAATDASLTEKLKRQKFTILFSYLIVVYMAFGVFMLVLYVFATMFLPQIPEISGAGSGVLSISAHKEEYTRLFMHASVIQGFFSGVIAGQMTGENAYDGLKHSVIMMTIAYIFFVVLV